ncbi:MAG: hypothetical protein M1819_004681 [Sarea resinae]|nr:MAG: hypothetical protein M1819_004681 [Sarea resinae]
MVAAQLREMKTEGIIADSGIYHAALKALSVHPDYLLRNAILEEMRQRWFSLTKNGWHDVIAGLLRERQFEMAILKLESMQREGVEVYGWLYNLFIYTLCEESEIEDALEILKHYQASRYAWKRLLETSALNIPSGIALNILITASKVGDTQLATDAFRLLGTRPAELRLHHYETLFDAFIRGGELENAMALLCMMQAGGLHPDEGTTRTMFQYLRAHPERPAEASRIMASLRKAGRDLPTVAVNCVIEASVYLDDLAQAIEKYKALHKVCSQGPNVMTFNILLHGCKDSGRKDLAMFLVSEMLAMKIRPNMLTYDRLLLACLSQDDYEDAFRYYEEMKGRGLAPRPGTFAAMVRKCASKGDNRAWNMLKEMEANGLDVTNLGSWLRDHWKGEGVLS